MRANAARLERAQMFFLLRRAHHQVYLHASRAVGQATGVPAAQMSALVHLLERDGLLVGELGGDLGLNSAGITGLVARLEREKLVRRSTSPDDARAVRLHITAHGRAVAARVGPLLAGISHQMTDGFSADESAVIRRFLDHLVAAFAPPQAKAPARRSRRRRTRRAP